MINLIFDWTECDHLDTFKYHFHGITLKQPLFTDHKAGDIFDYCFVDFEEGTLTFVKEEMEWKYLIRPYLLTVPNVD